MATSRRTATVLWLALVLFVLPVFQGKPGIYKNKFNKTCRYAARNISAALFKNGIDDGESWQLLHWSGVHLDHGLELHCMTQACNVMNTRAPDRT